MPDEPRYTLAEAAAELARQKCARDSHDLTQTKAWDGSTIEIWCERCGQRFIPAPEKHDVTITNTFVRRAQ